MFMYKKHLAYPIDIKRKDLRMAKYIITQYGGPYGELGAALRYFNQRYSMPDGKGNGFRRSRRGEVIDLCGIFVKAT